MQPSSADLATLERDVEVLSDRLRHLGSARLAAVSTQVRRHLRDLAALSLAAHARPEQPLPEVADAALGDQLAVLGREVLDGLRRRPDDRLLVEALACLADLRAALP